MDKLKEYNELLLTLVNDYNYLLQYNEEKYIKEKMTIYEDSIKYYLTQIKRINNKLRKKSGVKL